MCPCIIWCALVVYLLYHPLIQCVCVCVRYLSIGETCMSARFCWLVRFILGMGTLYVSLYNLVCFCCIPVVSPLNSMCVCVCVSISIYISIYLYIYMFYIYIYIYIFLMHIQNKKKKSWLDWCLGTTRWCIQTATLPCDLLLEACLMGRVHCLVF